MCDVDFTPVMTLVAAQEHAMAMGPLYDAVNLVRIRPNTRSLRANEVTKKDPAHPPTSPYPPGLPASSHHQ